MTNRQRNLGINIRVTPEEKKKIERNARKCRLSVSEYLRQIAMKAEPKELPSEKILQSIMRLQAEISLFERYSPILCPPLPNCLPIVMTSLPATLYLPF